MEQLLEEIGWLLVEAMLAGMVMTLVLVRLAANHERGERDGEQEGV
jgi:hypothetical protein